MSKLDELRSDLASVLLDVKPLALKGNEGTLTAEEDARFDELTKRVNEIKNDIVKAETTANAVKEVLELDKLYNRPANDDIKRGLHDNDPQAREKAINALKSPGRKFVESAQFLDSLKRGSGNMGSRDNGVKFDGFFGPGTGSFLLFGFVRFFAFDFLHASAATKLVNVATNLAAILMLASLGQINWPLGFAMMVANIAGSQFGSRLAIKHGSAFVRKAFLVIVSVLILKSAWNAYFLN